MSNECLLTYYKLHKTTAYYMAVLDFNEEIFDNLLTCCANSLVGARIMANGP